ncbi:MAG: hypothetical protein JOZ33_16455 [Acidobacteriaceae bacterium]|nr:hypothetical protein [Acidobacteriaceae bacterium]
MVAIIGLVFVALLLAVLFFVRGTVKPHVPAAQPTKGDTRPEDPRATGLN